MGCHPEVVYRVGGRGRRGGGSESICTWSLTDGTSD